MPIRTVREPVASTSKHKANEVVRWAIEDYKEALVDLHHELDAEDRLHNRGAIHKKRNQKPMATLNSNSYNRFLIFRDKRPEEFAQFIQLAHDFEIKEHEREREELEISQNLAQAELAGANRDELNKIDTELTMAISERRKLLSGNPDWILGNFCSKYLSALRRKDRKISHALPIHMVEIAILAKADQPNGNGKGKH